MKNLTKAESAVCQWQDVDSNAPNYKRGTSFQTRAALTYFRQYQQEKESA